MKKAQKFLLVIVLVVAGGLFTLLSGSHLTAASSLTALEFVNTYTAMESALFDTLIPNMKENPATYIDAIYLNDALRIKLTLKNAATLWADDAAESGTERTLTYIGRHAIQNGETIQIEHTLTACYEPDAGRFIVSVTENGKLLDRTECVKTEYGYIAQHYMLPDKKMNTSSLNTIK